MFFLCGCPDSEAQQRRKSEVLELFSKKDYSQLNSLKLSPGEAAAVLGEDALYFVALHYIEAGDEKNAVIFLERGKKQASPYFAALCAEKLTETGSPGQRLASARAFYRQSPENSRARLRLAERLYEDGQYEQALKTVALPPLEDFRAGAGTTGPDADGNELARVGLLCLVRTGSSAFFPYAESWFSDRTISSSHIRFCDELEETGFPETDSAEPPSAGAVLSPELLEAVIAMRAAVYERNYGEAVQSASVLAGSAGILSAPVMSDLGKSYLYGGTKHLENAVIFDAISSLPLLPDAHFLAVFYAGRLYERGGDITAASQRYLAALRETARPDYYDTALWYYLTGAAKTSAQNAVELLSSLGNTWNDSAYFADFLDSLSVSLLSSRSWDVFYQVYTMIRPFADPDTVAKYAYIAGRLLQENLVSPGVFEGPRAQAAETAFETAFRSDHTSMYYRVLSAERLGVPFEDMDQAMLYRRGNTAPEPDGDLEKLLFGYAAYGFPEKIYPIAARNMDSIGAGTAVSLSKEIAAAGGNDPKLYADSLRLMAASLNRTGGPVTRETLELLYPRHYSGDVSEVSQRFGLPEYLVYGLIRSESFFEADVVSHAGAIGLTQLMRPTASDIARKLRIAEYDLTDPQTNITFGAFYLDELLGRLDNVPILALFSYNAGITRVRNWVKNAPPLPLDLFLETVPFAETRDYGRKLLASSVLYGYLYYGKNPHEIVAEMFPDT